MSFQCSSASRKFLNFPAQRTTSTGWRGFSALQRAENSSISRDVIDKHTPRSFSALQRAEYSSMPTRSRPPQASPRFQCSSASRKFLNTRRARFGDCSSGGFSALQRAENSSIAPARRAVHRPRGFSALQRAENSSIDAIRSVVSAKRRRFSALQRAENSSIRQILRELVVGNARFSALQRAENSSIRRRLRRRLTRARVSVLFSEPKIPQLSAGMW